MEKKQPLKIITLPRKIEADAPVIPGVDSPNVYRLDKTFNVKDAMIFDDIQFTNRRGQIIRYSTFESSTGNSVYTMAVSEYLLGVTKLADAPTIGLPRPSFGRGKTYIVKDALGGAGTTTITVVSVGEENLDGASSSTLTSNYQAKRFYSDGANWFTW